MATPMRGLLSNATQDNSIFGGLLRMLQGEGQGQDGSFKLDPGVEPWQEPLNFPYVEHVPQRPTGSPYLDFGPRYAKEKSAEIDLDLEKTGQMFTDLAKIGDPGSDLYKDVPKPIAEGKPFMPSATAPRGGKQVQMEPGSTGFLMTAEQLRDEEWKRIQAFIQNSLSLLRKTPKRLTAQSLFGDTNIG